MIETAMVELIDRATAECAEQQRPDLHSRLRQIRTRALDPAQLVLIVGEPKQGKSELVNALVNAAVCDAGEDATTVVPTLVRHSEQPNALVIEQEPAQGPAALDRVPVPVEQVRERIEQAIGDGRPVSRGEVGLPRAVLKDGLTLMDTPGVGTTSTTLTARTLAVVAEADALLMVSDATQELTHNEISFLKKVTKLCPNVAVVQPKTDLSPHWRKVVEVNQRHLAGAGISAKVFPVSSTIRLQAMHARDGNLNNESGFPQLVEHLRSEALGKHDQLTRRLVAQNVADAVDELTETLKAELSAQSPRTAAETLVELETAQRRSEDLRRSTGHWQKTLNDGIGELFADIEFDFRERAWAITTQLNETMDEADPVLVWDDFVEWLENALAEAIEETFGWLDSRLERLSDEVADQFLREHPGARPRIEKLPKPEPFAEVAELKYPKNGEYRRLDQVLTGLRGSYGGVLMFGLVTNMLGLGLLNVVTITAGMLLGTRSLSEEKDVRKRRRQAEAKTSAQRYVEQVAFQVNKEAKDAIRRIHRTLHTHFTQLTEEAQLEISTAIQDIKRSAERSAVDREDRAREIRRKLEELAQLRRRAGMLTTNRITAA
ncbi:MAG: dynamin family protein [Saccharopolyspora sp.]|uniref:dynamin family protein n=1 Tax=Saccharopolyspora sp. TaxID=33915 RepID=UPI0025E9D918|nr:dynamin family protein [Saccharopolyspora sp.]MBQ6643560.1 dynamin family protein [Saccharopolyspora sp.]